MGEARSRKWLSAKAVGSSVTLVLGGILDAIFPKRCKGCQALLPLGSVVGLCPKCWACLRLARPPFCPLCGLPYLHDWPGNHLCRDCMLRTPPFLCARSWACYPRHPGTPHPLRNAVHRFKYGRKAAYGRVLGSLMAQGCKACLGKPNVIIPVPLHPQRLRWRGFNQAVILGKEVSRSWGVPLDPFVLRRSRPTRPQTELTRKERQPNVRGAFSTNPRRSLKGRDLLLVDDIYTSGATVKECTRVLLRAGARTVQVLTLARTI